MNNYDFNNASVDEAMIVMKVTVKKRMTIIMTSDATHGNDNDCNHKKKKKHQHQ